MSAVTVFNIFDLESEWQTAPDGFLSGNDFKTWLSAQVIKLRAQAAPLEAFALIHDVVGAATDYPQLVRYVYQLERRNKELDAPAQPVSAVELAAYRYYLGDTDDRPLCELFEDMSASEHERYSMARNGNPTELEIERDDGIPF